MALERTLSIVKPDGVSRNLIGEVYHRFEKAGLTGEEKDLIRRRDWRGLIHYGAIFFMLEKLAAVIGVSNLHVYAAMRGETLEDFLQTRNTQVVYGVGGGKVDRPQTP